MKKRITKSNAIINSSYRLSLNELRIVLYGLAHINPRSDEFPLFHTINVRELAEFYDIGEKDRGSFYDDIKDALVKKFWEREFSYFDEKLEKIIKRRWLIEVQYGGKKDGILSYHYNPMIKDQLQQLASKFTSYFLTNIANMKSTYAIRLYEIAIMYLNASKQMRITFTKTIKDLKNHLDIADKYKNFSDMKRRILEKAKKEINKNSDIKFTYKVIKLGKSPHKIEFTVSKKANEHPEEYPKLYECKSTKLSTAVFEKAKKIIQESDNRWDIYAIEQQFYDFVKKKGTPESLEGAFLGFVKKKVSNPP